MMPPREVIFYLGRKLESVSQSVKRWGHWEAAPLASGR